MSHGNARLTPAGRLLLVQRVAAGEPQAEATCQMRLSPATVAKWWSRWVEHGDAGLADRSSRLNRSPRRTDAAIEERICRLRSATKRGPGVSVGTHRGAGLDDLADPPLQLPPTPHRNRRPARITC